MELRIGALATMTAPAYRVGDDVLVPLSSLLRLAEIRCQIDAAGTLEATLQPGNVRLVIAAARDTMRYGGRHVVIARELKLFHGGELYVGARPLDELLGLRIVVDWPDLTVTIVDPGSLPVGRRVAREAARNALLWRDEAAAGPVVSHALERPRWDGLVVDYAISAPGADPLRAGSYSLAAGTNAFGGSLETTVTGSGMAPSRAVRSTASWTGVWSDNTWVKQVRLGDGISTGLAPRLVRGATVTNSPFLRPTQFGINSFGGLLAPGWEVEAYRGGQLIAFDSTDTFGRYTIPIPTQYGENPVDLVAYGPFGEVRRIDRMYRVVGELLPARQIEYGASVGSCPAGSCTGTANVDLRYGVSSRWTVRAGYDGFRRDTLASLSHPYTSLAGSVTDAIGVQLEGVSGSSARGLVRYEPSTRLRVATEYTHFAMADSIPILTPKGWRARWLVSALVRPKGLMSSAYLEGDAAQIETVTGTTSRARLLTSAAWRDVRVSPYVRLERDAPTNAAALSRSFMGVNTSILPRAQWGNLLGRAWVRTTLEVERAAGLSEASVAVARQFVRGVRVEAGARWTRTSAVATLLTSVDLATVRSYTTVLVPKAGTTTAGEFLQGSVVVNTATREIALAPGPSLQRSGVAGRVFLDENTNGLFDVGEPAVPGVTVRVGTTAATSDSTGWFEVWNVAPYEPAMVTLDSLSLPSPLWIPGFTTMTVVPGPNRFVLVDVPIEPGGTVEGRVLLQTSVGGEGVGNARLTLVDRRTGTRRVVTTFLDGAFLAVGVRPGSYEVTVDEQLLAQLQAIAEPTHFALRAAKDGTAITGVDVLLRRGAVAEIDSTPRAATAVRIVAPVTSQAAPPVTPAMPQGEPLAPRGDGPPTRAVTVPAVVTPSSTRPPVRVYTVRPHDTLRRIARRVLGAEERWIEIYRANRARIKHPDLILPGQRLTIDLAGRRTTHH
jgi:LysM domain-containing protein